MLPTKLLLSLCFLLATVHVRQISALVEPLDYLPQDLQGYLDTCHSTGDLTQRSARLVFWLSINQYTSKFVKSRPDLSNQQVAYLRSTLEDAFAPLYANTSQPRWGGRVKRQALARRVRKEIRAMTVGERRRYFAALNALKTDRRLPPNVYDFLADYHSGDNIGRAHFGPAFPSWHRLYLWILEYFLRLHDPTVSIPFWASVLDNDMDDHTQSVLWSSSFYGNGDGEIRTGPFQNWSQINPATRFTRNVQRTELYTFDGINRILSRTNNSQILVPTAEADSDFESQHGSAHVAVGGSMNDLNSAARDPIFYSHHAFVDQIWERFRMNQIRNGINPQTDYPFIENDPRFRPQHRPTANAGFAGLSGARTWTQNLGYINAFSNLVIYEQVPSCPRCANSPYLYCNRNLRPARCVSRTRAEMRRLNDIVGPNGPPAGRVRRQAPVTFPPDGSLDVCPKKTFLNDIETKWFGISNPTPAPSNNNWAYIPVKIVAKRPSEYEDFNRYSLYRQGTTAHLGLKNEFLKQSLQKRFESCDKYQDAVGKITIVSHGLNYEGYSEEYVLLDNRLGVAEANAFIPVKMPTASYPAEAIIAAFDSCGRVCKPFCKTGSSGTMATEMKFTGGVRVSYPSPKHYFDSYADAMLNIWDIPSQSSCPTINYNNIPISFFCEYTDTWIWGSGAQLPGPGPNLPVQGQGSHIWPGMELPHQTGHVGGGSMRPIHPTQGKNWGIRPPHRPFIPFRGTSKVGHPVPQIERYDRRGAGVGRQRGRRRRS